MISIPTLVLAGLVLAEEPNPDELKVQVDNALPIAGLFVLHDAWRRGAWRLTGTCPLWPKRVARKILR